MEKSISNIESKEKGHYQYITFKIPVLEKESIIEKAKKIGLENIVKNKKLKDSNKEQCITFKVLKSEKEKIIEEASKIGLESIVLHRKPRESIRDQYITFRISKSEKEKIKNKAKKLGLEHTDYCRKLILEKDFNIKNVPIINEKAVMQIRKIGVNLNQLVKLLNTKPDIINGEKVLNRINEIFQDLNKMKSKYDSSDRKTL